MKVFGCLHKQVKWMCFYAIMSMPFGAWKNQNAFLFYFGYSFLTKNSITMLRLQASSILGWAVAVGQLLLNFHPFKTHLPSPQPTYCKRLIFDMKKIGLTFYKQSILTWIGFDI
jgi:hypothetical protein